MIELWVLEQDRTRQRFCGSLDRAMADAREALEAGKPVQIVPRREPDETP